MDAARAAATGAEAPKEVGEDEGTKRVDGTEELSEDAREEGEKGLLLPPSPSSEEDDDDEEDPDLELGEKGEEKVEEDEVVRCVDDREE
jgi:hypothetical protein